jgi:hypothetical protein
MRNSGAQSMVYEGFHGRQHTSQELELLIKPTPTPQSSTSTLIGSRFGIITNKSLLCMKAIARDEMGLTRRKVLVRIDPVSYSIERLQIITAFMGMTLQDLLHRFLDFVQHHLGQISSITNNHPNGESPVILSYQPLQHPSLR